MTEPSLAPPIHHETVRPDWIDYNGHMNVAYYVLAFDHATDRLLDALGLGRDYAEREGRSIFVVESHIAYRRELQAGDPMAITSRLLGFDDKRIHLFQRMTHADEGHLAATMEIMAVHVDMATRRTAPLPTAAEARLGPMLQRHRSLVDPAEVGRAIAPPRRSAGSIA